MSDQVSLHITKPLLARRFWLFGVLACAALLLFGVVLLFVLNVFAEPHLLAPDRAQLLSATWVRGTPSCLRLKLRLTRSDGAKLRGVYGPIYVTEPRARQFSPATVRSQTVAPNGSSSDVIVDSPSAPPKQPRPVEIVVYPPRSASRARYLAAQMKVAPPVYLPFPETIGRFTVKPPSIR